MVAMFLNGFNTPTNKVNKLIKSDQFSIAALWSSINNKYLVPWTVNSF